MTIKQVDRYVASADELKSRLIDILKEQYSSDELLTFEIAKEPPPREI